MREGGGSRKSRMRWSGIVDYAKYVFCDTLTLLMTLVLHWRKRQMLNSSLFPQCSTRMVTPGMRSRKKRNKSRIEAERVEAGMKIQMLVSAVNQDVRTLAERMNIRTDAVIINQCGQYGYEEYEHNSCSIHCYSFKERGVGLSRNSALMRAQAEISVFADEDIAYEDGYEKKIEEAFDKNKEADMILFNVKVAPSRRTYWNEGEKRIHWYNYGRYPAYSIAARTDSLHRANVSFSLLFGGGAKYSNGEDSLFLRDCLKKGLKIFASTEVIGEEKERESTWFHGYNDKFFRDRGVLYHFLYGKMAVPFSLRFLMAHREEMCGEIGWKKAYGLMKEGIEEGKGKTGQK